MLTIEDSTVSGNSTSGTAHPGGGVYSRVGKLRVESSTISGNVAGGTGAASGGGIYYVPDTDGLSSARHGATIIDSVIVNNSAVGNGGGALWTATVLSRC